MHRNMSTKLLGKVSPLRVILFGVGAALVALVVLGTRVSFGFEVGEGGPRLGQKPIPAHHVTCDGVIPTMLQSDSSLCRSMAEDKLPGVLIESIAIGLAVSLIYTGISMSGTRRTGGPTGPLLADQLQKLVHLHESDQLSDEEFAAAKQALLG